ncbi:MAG: tRNA threonylcarbamoyladenosine dehydratase [Candidatus Aegiribacteria sp.]|nr:tRNA threonylcarbamoyladenosine dehydratase [Candidatus Aegiribacteria sp.]MBD3294952.1 tRNA threonylcarbamoyladenosine dehydratase [Candidatus Fermentibacteria bacterium]
MAERRFHRVVDLFGEEGFQRIRDSQVTVVGLGGVGCHAAIALARSGIGRLHLVDFDKVTETSLNRNPIAGQQDCGGYKVDVVSQQLRITCPDTETTVLKEFFHNDTADLIFSDQPDAAVDAIDSLNPKTELIRHCVSTGIPLFSSMGASGRRDPSLVRTGNIFETSCCPLARQLRKYLRKRGVTEGVQCVYSVENAEDHSLPPDTEELTYQRGRVRNRIPSMITMPGIFGYALAGMVLEYLSGKTQG